MTPQLKEIATIFLRLGVLGFGGPVAVMAMMEEQTVRKRGWLTPEAFGEVYAICKMLPGPVGTQMAIYLGRLRGGTLGGVVAGLAFILPCFFLVLALSSIYVRTGLVGGAANAMLGLQAGALSIILLSTWQLGRSYLSAKAAWMIVSLCAVAVYFYPSHEPWVILGIGLFGAIRARVKSGLAGFAGLGVGSLFVLSKSRFAAASAGGAVAMSASLGATGWHLFWTCLKAGFLVFGTGLAVVPVLEGEAVGRFHWLSHSQFMDGLAIGQITPGPVVITATFIGYLAAGLWGALSATFGMFLPSFINVLVILPRVWKRIGGSAGMRGFSQFAIPAVVGGILGTAMRLGIMTLTQWQPTVVFVGAMITSVVFAPPAWILLPVAGLVSALLFTPVFA